MAEGYKDWAAGDILTAADLEDYTVKQSVMRFADASARTTALSGVLVEGMMSYLKDTDSVEVYDGSSWSAVAGGKILQVVFTTKTDTFSASIAAGADTAITGLSATITPTSATSKILVMFQAAGARANDLPYFFVRLYRGATEIGSGATASNRTSVIQASGIVAADTTAIGPLSGHFLDSPATTSATTYALHAANVGISTHTYYVNRSQDDLDQGNYPRSSSSITVMEVSA